MKTITLKGFNVVLPKHGKIVEKVIQKILSLLWDIL